MHLLLYPLAFLLGAIGRRTAGGALNEVFYPRGDGRVFQGDYPVRAAFAALLAAATLLGHLSAPFAAAVLVGTFLGAGTGNKLILPYLGEFGGIDLGHGRLPLWRGYVGLTYHGLGQVGLPVAAVLLARNFGVHVWLPAVWPIAVAGLLCAPLYHLAWALGGWRFPVPGWPRPVEGGFHLAEALWGGALGVGYLVAALVG